MARTERDAHRDVFLVAATPPVASRDLMGSVFAGAAGVFGVRAVEDIASGPGCTALVTVTHADRALRQADIATSCDALSIAVAKHLVQRGSNDVLIEAQSLGTLMTSSPLGEVADHWVKHLSGATTVTAPSHSYEERIGDLISRGAIRTLYQPILHVPSGQVVGYEALSRGPRGDELEGASQLLDAGRRGGLEAELSATMAHLARVRAARLLAGNDLLLFVNVDPAALWQPTRDLRPTDADPALWPAERTVVEITERIPISDAPEFVQCRDIARREGVRFALDDVGAGFSGLTTLALLAPDFLKVDMGLVRDCDRDDLKLAVIDALVYLCARSGSTLIAEGVETERELAALRGLGVELVQGFLIAQPAETPQWPRTTSWTNLAGRRTAAQLALERAG
jgi:EAL domain-containing protein (putative c-di-GMP-specific phosphodiesterase class I)